MRKSYTKEHKHSRCWLLLVSFTTSATHSSSSLLSAPKLLKALPTSSPGDQPA